MALSVDVCADHLIIIIISQLRSSPRKYFCNLLYEFNYAKISQFLCQHAEHTVSHIWHLKVSLANMKVDVLFKNRANPLKDEEAHLL